MDQMKVPEQEAIIAVEWGPEVVVWMEVVRMLAVDEEAVALTMVLLTSLVAAVATDPVLRKASVAVVVEEETTVCEEEVHALLTRMNVTVDRHSVVHPRLPLWRDLLHGIGGRFVEIHRLPFTTNNRLMDVEAAILRP